MTDATRSTDITAETRPDLRTLIQRRLVGLAVLLAGVFLLSLLLRHGARSPDVLPVVVIPLGASGSAEGRLALGEAPGDSPEVTAGAANVPGDAREVLEADAPLPEPAIETSPTPVEREPVKPRTEPVPPKPAASAARPASISAAKPTTVPKNAAGKSVVAPRWFVAVGSYKDPMAAQAIANRVKLAGFKADVGVVTVNKDKLQRVRAGPFTSEAAAESARVTLIVEGLTKAVTLSEK